MEVISRTPFHQHIGLSSLVGLPYLYDDLWLMTITDNHQLEWSEIKPKGPAPSARYSHSATYFDNKILFFGGFDGNRFLNDFLVLERNGNGKILAFFITNKQILNGFQLKQVEFLQLPEQAILQLFLQIIKNYSFLAAKMN